MFANPPAKWPPPLNIVEYPGVTGATCCHIIPLCLKSHQSKCATPGKVVLKGGGGRLPRTEAECSPGTRTGLNVKRCSCCSGACKNTATSRLMWGEESLLPLTHLFVLCPSASLHGSSLRSGSFRLEGAGSDQLSPLEVTIQKLD